MADVIRLNKRLTESFDLIVKYVNEQMRLPLSLLIIYIKLEAPQNQH